MNCWVCKVTMEPPCRIYCCDNSHWHCWDCAVSSAGRCDTCGLDMNLMQLKYDSSADGPALSTPGLKENSNLVANNEVNEESSETNLCDGDSICKSMAPCAKHPRANLVVQKTEMNKSTQTLPSINIVTIFQNRSYLDAERECLENSSVVCLGMGPIHDSICDSVESSETDRVGGVVDEMAEQEESVYSGSSRGWGNRRSILTEGIAEALINKINSTMPPPCQNKCCIPEHNTRSVGVSTKIKQMAMGMTPKIPKHYCLIKCITEPLPAKQTSAKMVMDECAQKTFEILHETSGKPKITEKPDDLVKYWDSNEPSVSTESIVSNLEETVEVVADTSLVKCSPVYHLYSKLESRWTLTPQHELETVPQSTESTWNVAKCSKATNVVIDHCPIKCPDTFCQRLLFVTDLCGHLLEHHHNIFAERIVTGQLKTLLIDPEIAHAGVIACNAVFLLRDMVTGFGCNKYKDMLPLIVLSTRVSVEELQGVKGKKSNQGLKNEKRATDFVLIWVTGPATKVPITATLAACGRSKGAPRRSLVICGHIHPAGKNEAVKDILEGSTTLLLSHSQLDCITNSGRYPLELQLILH